MGDFFGGLFVAWALWIYLRSGFVSLVLVLSFLILLVLFTWWFVTLVLNFVLNVGSVGNFSADCRTLWIW